MQKLHLAHNLSNKKRQFQKYHERASVPHTLLSCHIWDCRFPTSKALQFRAVDYHGAKVNPKKTVAALTE
jgi:hypothetical protein